MQNSVEVKRTKLKCKYEIINNAFQNTHCGTAFEDLKTNRLTKKFKIKVYVNKQLLLVTKLEYKEVNIIS